MRKVDQTGPHTLSTLRAVTNVVLDLINRLGDNSAREERFRQIKEADYRRATMHGHGF